jgi:hypothetical protein
VQHLASADKIVVLGGGGNVTHVGTFAELQSLLELRQSLFTEPQREQEEETSSAPKKQQKAKPQSTVTDDARAEEARKSTELSDYRDYFKSMGWARAVSFVIITILFAFCSKFSRTSRLH